MVNSNICFGAGVALVVEVISGSLGFKFELGLPKSSSSSSSSSISSSSSLKDR